MVTLRCTAKLLDKLGIERRPPDPGPPTTVLGDWYADILFTRPAHLVLCISERSFFPVVVAARDLESLVPRFISTLGELLAGIGIPEEAIERERSAMEPFSIGATADRRVLGTLVEFVKLIKMMLPDEPDFTIFDWSRHLAEVPCLTLPSGFPSKATRELLVPGSRFTILDGGKA